MSVEKYRFLFFMLYHTNYNFITCSGLFSFLVQAKQLIPVHNFVQVNILIRIHCPKSLGFDFKNHGGQFGVVSPQRSQMKTASILQSA